MAASFKFGDSFVEFEQDIDGFIEACQIANNVQPQIINRFNTEYAKYESIEDVCANVIRLAIDCVSRFYFQFTEMYNDRGMSGTWDWFMQSGRLMDVVGDIVEIVQICEEEIDRLDRCEGLGNDLNQLRTDMRHRYHNYSSGQEWLSGALGAGIKNLANYGYHKAKQSHADSKLANEIQKKKNEMFSLVHEKIVPSFPDRINLLFEIIKEQLNVEPGFSPDEIIGYFGKIKKLDGSRNVKNNWAREMLEISPISEDVYQYIFENLDEEHIEDALSIANYFNLDISNAFKWLCLFDNTLFNDWHQSNWLRNRWEDLKLTLSLKGCSQVLVDFLEKSAKCKVENKKETLKEYAIFAAETELQSFQILSDMFSNEDVPKEYVEAKKYITEQSNLFAELRDNISHRLDVAKQSSFIGVLFALENGFSVRDSKKLYVGEKISDRKLRNVLLGYAKGMGIKRKDVWVLWDNTAFGTGNDGFIFTHDKIVLSDKNVINLSDIDELYVDNKNRQLICKNKSSSKEVVLANEIPEKNRIGDLVRFMFHPATMDANCLDILEKDKDGSIMAEKLSKIDDKDEENILRKEKSKYTKKVLFGSMVVLVFSGLFIINKLDESRCDKERTVKATDKIVLLDNNEIKEIIYYSGVKERSLTSANALFDGDLSTVWKIKNDKDYYGIYDFDNINVVFKKKQKIVGYKLYAGNHSSSSNFEKCGKPKGFHIVDYKTGKELFGGGLGYSGARVGSYHESIDKKYTETDTLRVGFRQVNTKNNPTTEISDLKFYIVKDRPQKNR